MYQDTQNDFNQDGKKKKQKRERKKQKPLELQPRTG